MNNGFPYWQFHSEQWLTGKVSAFDLEGQGLFLQFCMQAWAAKGPFNICSTSVQLKFRKSKEWVAEIVRQMEEVGIIVRDGENYRIKFIDSQIEHMAGIRQVRVDAGHASAQARQKSPRRRAEKGAPQSPPKEGENTQEKKSSVFNVCSTHVHHPQLAQSESFMAKWKLWVETRMAMGRAPKSWENMFHEQIEFLKVYPTDVATEILSASIRGNWQGLFPPKGGGSRTAPREPLNNTHIAKVPDQKMRSAF